VSTGLPVSFVGCETILRGNVSRLHSVFTPASAASSHPSLTALDPSFASALRNNNLAFHLPVLPISPLKPPPTAAPPLPPPSPTPSTPPHPPSPPRPVGSVQPVCLFHERRPHLLHHHHALRDG
jgi:hypothetical protein